MKFYKLELINREESYNNMFGRNPNVGVMNPLVAGKGKNPAGMTGGGMPPLAPQGPSLGLGGKAVAAAPPKTNNMQQR